MAIISRRGYTAHMATTEEILKAARALGDTIGQHAATKKFEDAAMALQKDVEAQRALNDFNRFLQTLHEKETQGKPIEVAEKRKLETLQQAVIRNSTLSKFQMAQMDYMDLMRKVDAAINGEAPGEGIPGGATHPEVSSILLPDN
jgi:cell fate (sporulation/competence/biofilm development) regulator YlbF (YheA/YmcA/DUF963 family)